MFEIDPVTAAGVQSRAKVHSLILSDLRAALGEARSNPHPWYRCQSLTYVAEATTDDVRAAAILTEALSAAKQHDEPNRVVSVAAWPVEVAMARSLLDVPSIVGELLAIISPGFFDDTADAIENWRP